jgi:hypothetical protein
MEKLGMGTLLSVARGSAEDGCERDVEPRPRCQPPERGEEEERQVDREREIGHPPLDVPEEVGRGDEEQQRGQEQRGPDEPPH